MCIVAPCLPRDENLLAAALLGCLRANLIHANGLSAMERITCAAFAYPPRGSQRRQRRRKSSEDGLETAPAMPVNSRGLTLPVFLAILLAMGYGLIRLEVYAGCFARRDKEAELLLYGRAYMRAIESFYRAGQGASARYPGSFEELISDQRFPGRRHMRRLYKDPLTGGEFVAVRNKDRGIVGVVSSSNDAPFRKRGFDAELAGFEKASSYREWRFDASKGTPTGPANGGAQAVAVSAPVAVKTASAR
jgi:hypothetical protein